MAAICTMGKCDTGREVVAQFAGKVRFFGTFGLGR